MSLPRFLSFGKSYSGKTIDRSKDTSSEVIDASQTSNATVKLGSGATIITAGDYDTTYAGSGTDTVYGARGSVNVVGAGSDTFVYGVGSKAQAAGMIGACTVGDTAYQGETIAISKSFLDATSLAAAITAANNESLDYVNANGRLLTIDAQGDSINFLSGDTLSASQFKLV